jgi:uncharacterized phage-associated protein
MRPLQRRDDVEKAVEAAAVLLRMESSRQLSRLRLVKLLYIAHRRAIRDTGIPLLRSEVVAMKHGPVHSEVLDLINENHRAIHRWAKFIKTDGPRNVQLIEQPSVSELSHEEIEILQRVSRELEEFSDWEVAELTHTFQEWDRNYPDKNANTSYPIPFEQVIEFATRSRDDADEIIQHLRDEQEFDELFSS